MSCPRARLRLTQFLERIFIFKNPAPILAMYQTTALAKLLNSQVLVIAIPRGISPSHFLSVLAFESLPWDKQLLLYTRNKGRSCESFRAASPSGMSMKASNWVQNAVEYTSASAELNQGSRHQ